ncbi:hypothetical protein LEP1GSC050_1819 [Leptospira broomii serovar Hurstbridge str. 5399]|uniref:Uncharacterized protein n=1 Tax=Leptospira broomii serovar Hurstbridge str. 5399 TaxID=1049789 RepID=T0FH91_9LEPT|nr:hypothetical protein [Leptospira broomii]EQA47336.1 hypothetical protein LEP1GSC050_1819 [Leptospira broomii serovar Hurstbridge str. 5399]
MKYLRHVARFDPTNDKPAHEYVSILKPGSEWRHERIDDKWTIDIIGKVSSTSPSSFMG